MPDMINCQGVGSALALMPQAMKPDATTSPKVTETYNGERMDHGHELPLRQFPHQHVKPQQLVGRRSSGANQKVVESHQGSILIASSAGMIFILASISRGPRRHLYLLNSGPN